MYGLGTLINVAAIILGGLIGMLFGKKISEGFQSTLRKSTGVCVLFIGIAGALEGMLSVGDDGKITAGGSVLIILCVALGSVIGELINIEGGFEKFGAFLKRKTGSQNDNNFISGFLLSSFTVCIGAMAVVGAIEDAINADISILITKAILDFIIIMVMAGSLGKGCIFSAIPVAVLQGAITALAVLIKPVLTDAALTNLSTVGSVLIFCVGINLTWDNNKIKVANMLPAILFAIAAAFLPFSL